MKERTGSIRTCLLIGTALTLGATTLVVAQQSTPRRKTLPVTTSQSSSQVSGSASASSRSGGIAIANGQQSGRGSAFGSGVVVTKPLFAAWYQAVPDRASQDQIRASSLEHGDYMQLLAKQNVLVLEGPFKDMTGFMAVIQADNLDTAVKTIAADPAVQRGSFRVEVKPWQPRFGPVSTNSGAEIKPATGIRRTGGG